MMDDDDDDDEMSQATSVANSNPSFLLQQLSSHA
jgi:hypothetical protein